MLEVEASSNNGEVTYDSGRPLPFLNHSGLPDSVIMEGGGLRQVASQLSNWVNNARAAVGRSSMFDRGAYTPPRNAYDEMRSAAYAVENDDIVGGVHEITESFAFEGIKWESPNPDDADAFNQLSEDVGMDELVRKMWLDEYTYSQFVCTKIWGWCDYTVRGETSKGNKRKKSYHFWAPKIIRTQNPLKIVPVGLGPLAGDLLAWQATPAEINSYEAAYRGDKVDPLMLAFFEGKYDPDAYEMHQLVQLGVIPSRLLMMSPEFTFRHTMTKADYERFPRVRLKSCFHLLDLKQQLVNADRATLIGAATYILLIRKGSKEQPAKPEEMANLRENYNFLAKLPVIISDHRLEIDIIAPKTDFVLQGERYDVLDNRLRARLLGTLTSGRSASSRGGENESMVSGSVARVMQNHRHMLRLTIQREVANAIVNHPRNKGVFETAPKLVYTPRNIALSMDPAYAQGLLSLRTQREISRETILEYWGLDESTEAMRMEMEAEFYDDIFKTEIPYTAGAPGEGVDPSLDKGDAPPPPAAKGGTGNADAVDAPKGTKDGPNRKGPNSAPASGQPATGRRQSTPNGTPEAPAISGRRGGRPKGGGQSRNSPAATAKPRTPRGNVSTRASEESSDDD